MYLVTSNRCRTPTVHHVHMHYSDPKKQNRCGCSGLSQGYISFRHHVLTSQERTGSSNIAGPSPDHHKSILCIKTSFDNKHHQFKIHSRADVLSHPSHPVRLFWHTEKIRTLIDDFIRWHDLFHWHRTDEWKLPVLLIQVSVYNPLKSLAICFIYCQAAAGFVSWHHQPVPSLSVWSKS